jgi:hypothetical protein
LSISGAANVVGLRADRKLLPFERRAFVQYMILIYGNENEFAQMAQGATREQLYEAFKQYSQDLMDAGVLRAGGELKPTTTATTVRLREGKLTTTDGPFAETKEQLGGYYIIDVPNLDEAIKWAARCPLARSGSIEVRPLGVTPASRGKED